VLCAFVMAAPSAMSHVLHKGVRLREPYANTGGTIHVGGAVLLKVPEFQAPSYEAVLRPRRIQGVPCLAAIPGALCFVVVVFPLEHLRGSRFQSSPTPVPLNDLKAFDSKRKDLQQGKRGQNHRLRSRDTQRSLPWRAKHSAKS